MENIANTKMPLTDYEIGRYAQEARNFLNTFGSDAVASKRAEFLQESLERYESAASRGHSRFRGLGIVEAMVAAFAWTIFLIAISFVLKYNGIDLFEIYQKVPGH